MSKKTRISNQQNNKKKNKRTWPATEVEVEPTTEATTGIKTEVELITNTEEEEADIRGRTKVKKTKV